MELNTFFFEELSGTKDFLVRMHCNAPEACFLFLDRIGDFQELRDIVATYKVVGLRGSIMKAISTVLNSHGMTETVIIVG